METKIFTSEEIKHVKIVSLAHKYKCSENYVRLVLKGLRERNSELSQKIVADATDMLQIIERDTIITI